MRILHLDLETSYLVGAVWKMWDTSVAQVLKDPYILGYGYAWNHLPGVHWVGLSDFPSAYAKDPSDDRQLMKALWKLIDEADVIVAHNGKAFDVKKVRGRFLANGLPPPKKFEVVDTKTVAKQFGFASNKLDELSRQLLGERKIKHDGIELWTRCMAKKLDQAAWKQMGDYCKQDVVLLKRLYQLMLPWINNHPNWNVYSDMPPGCTNCGSGQIVKNGQDYTRTTVRQSYVCKKCGCRMRGESRKMTDIK